MASQLSVRSSGLTTTRNLDTMFAPRSIAIVGASEKSNWSGMLIRNYRDFGFRGDLFAVNRSGKPVFGVPGFESIGAIGRPVDLALLVVPQDSVLDALHDAAQAGVRNVVVLASGYAEAGAAGAAMQDELVARARSLGVNLWGPNSLGFNNIVEQTPVSPIPTRFPLIEPSIAIVTQSGQTASLLNNYAYSQNIGVSFVAATGNEAALTSADVIDWLVDHESTKAIAVLVESVKDPEAFARAARRALKAGKPLAVLKIGRSELASAVAEAHTGSLVGNDAVFDAVCRTLGIIRVHTAEDLVNVSGLLAATGRFGPGGLGFISHSGGACTLVADAADDLGVAMPAFDAATKARLQAELPGFASSLNPLDVTGAAIADPDLLARVLGQLSQAEEIGIVGIGCSVPTREGEGVAELLEAIGRGAAEMDKPCVIVSTCADVLNDVSRETISRLGLPHAITGIASALRAIERAIWWSAQDPASDRALLPDRPERGASGRLRTEREALDYLSSRQVPVVPGRIVNSGDEAGRAAAEIDAPLCLKIVSPDIAHKTEAGGVRLNVKPADAAKTFDSIMADVARHQPDARMDGVVVSPMRESGLELIVGVTRDPVWGPTITIGFGGILVELLSDAVVRTLPIDRAGVREAIGSLRGARLLQGFRGAEAVDLDRLADVVVAIGEAAMDLGPQLASLEVNPLLVTSKSPEALDALVIWNDETAHPNASATA